MVLICYFLVVNYRKVYKGNTFFPIGDIKMKVDSQNRIVKSIDSTLVEVGPVTTTLEETYRKSGIWHIELVFNYNGQKVDTVTGRSFDSETIDLQKGVTLLNEFLTVNNLYVLFPENEKLDSQSEMLRTGIKTLTRKGTAYVHKDKDWFKTDYLENRTK